MEAYQIPKRLDEPERLAFWTLDEALVLIAPIGIGMIAGWMATGVVLGVGFYLALRKLKGNGSANLARFVLYWFLPPVFGFRVTPPSAVRRYV